MRDITVSYPHRQHISVIMRLLEQTIISTERSFSDGTPAATLTKYCDPVPRETAEKLRPALREIRDVIDQMAVDLGLMEYEEHIARSLSGALHVRLVGVTEIEPRYLRAGGEVPPELVLYAGEKSRRLQELLWSLIGELESLTRRAESSITS